MNISEFTHPDDLEALKLLNSIPVLPKVMKKFMDMGMEQLYFGLNKALKIRLSPTQLPEIYNILPPICDQLEIVEPEFYLEMNPMPNAYAFGDTKTAITVTSSLVEMMSKDELTAVVAHECGHIACHHMLYHSLAQILANASGMFEALANLAGLNKQQLDAAMNGIMGKIGETDFSGSDKFTRTNRVIGIGVDWSF